MTSLPIFLSLFLNKNTKIILRISGLPKINFVRYLFWKIFSKKIFKVTCPTKSTYDYILKKKMIIRAFQRHFRQKLVNGIADQECLVISTNLLKS